MPHDPLRDNTRHRSDEDDWAQSERDRYLSLMRNLEQRFQAKNILTRLRSELDDQARQVFVLGTDPVTGETRAEMIRQKRYQELGESLDRAHHVKNVVKRPEENLS